MAAGEIAVAALGALCLAVGFVAQQHAAAQEPAEESLSPRLLASLLRRPVWLAGIAAMIAGQVLGAVALGHGDLALVEPIMAANLLFALPLSAAWHRRRLGRREWLGAVCLVAGMGAFIAAGDPHGGTTAHLSWPNWVEAGGGIVAFAAVLVPFARRAVGARRATLLATAAGTLYGLQDALTRRTLAQLGHGLTTVVTSWPVFALLLVAATGLLLGQSAFEAAPLDASLPAITVAEPITGIAFGIGVYGEHINLDGPWLALELVGLAAMVAGVVLVGSSPVVTGGESGDRVPETLGNVA